MSIYNSFENFKASQASSLDIRPDCIRASIQQRFQEVVQSERTSLSPYLFAGDTSYVFSFFNATLDIGETINKLISPAEPQYSILDVGTGDGSFITAQSTNDISVLGIAADQKLLNPDIPQNKILIGNAEDLEDMQDLKDYSFNLIVSKQTLKHFVDPLGFVEKAHQKLATGGYLVVDDFKTPGLASDELLLMICHLQSLGHHIVIDFNFTTQGINSLIIQKNHPLKMPVHYNDVLTTEGVASYKLNDSINKNRNTYIIDLFDKITAKYQGLPFSENTNQDYLKICHSDAFKSLSYEQKYLYLKKSLLSNETPLSFFNLVDSALKEHSDLTDVAYHKAACLFTLESFSRFNLDEQQQRFKEAIALDIFIAHQYDLIKKMGLPYFEMPFTNLKYAFDPDAFEKTTPSLPKPFF
ncbi:MAG: methyltransferase domain-containing protein [Gammaproteobacteria bacterium]